MTERYNTKTVCVTVDNSCSYPVAFKTDNVDILVYMESFRIKKY